MPPKKDSVVKDNASSVQVTEHSGSEFVDDFIKALKDESVLASLGLILGSILDSRLQAALAPLLAPLKEENSRLRRDLQAATDRIEMLEAHDRKSNLIITGLPTTSYLEAASLMSGEQGQTSEHAETTEKSVLDLCNNRLHVPIMPQDISIAHRLKKKANSTEPASVIVRFTNYKARDAVYRARLNLKGTHGNGHRVFISEDLTKSTANLFRQARSLVREKTLHAAWTAGGTVFVKQTDNPSCRPKRVTSAADLTGG
jgi:hypothetical protein